MNGTTGSYEISPELVKAFMEWVSTGAHGRTTKAYVREPRFGLVNLRGMLDAAAALGYELEVVNVKHTTKARKDLSKQNEFRIRAITRKDGEA